MLKETCKINEIGVLGFTCTLCCYMMKNSHLLFSIKLIRVLIINLGKYTLSNLSYASCDDVGEHSFSHEASGRAGGVDLGPSAGSGTWALTPSHVSSSSLFKQGSDSRYLATSSAQQYMTHAFEPIMLACQNSSSTAYLGVISVHRQH